MARRPNALISGSRKATHAYLLGVEPYFRPPIRRVACDALRSLPPAGGTVILDDVDLLDSQQQEMLLRWLDESSRTGMQVISLTSTALYNHVQVGAFLNVLYYRLNVMYVEVGRSDRPTEASA